MILHFFIVDDAENRPNKENVSAVYEKYVKIDNIKLFVNHYIYLSQKQMW